MTRFFFDLHECGHGVVIDEEGSELPDPAAVGVHHASDGGADGKPDANCVIGDRAIALSAINFGGGPPCVHPGKSLRDATSYRN